MLDPQTPLTQRRFEAVRQKKFLELPDVILLMAVGSSFVEQSVYSLPSLFAVIEGNTQAMSRASIPLQMLIEHGYSFGTYEKALVLSKGRNLPLELPREVMHPGLILANNPFEMAFPGTLESQLLGKLPPKSPFATLVEGIIPCSTFSTPS